MKCEHPLPVSREDVKAEWEFLAYDLSFRFGRIKLTERRSDTSYELAL